VKGGLYDRFLQTYTLEGVEEFLTYMKDMIPLLKDDQDKLEYAKDFLKDRCEIDDTDDVMVYIGPINANILQYFIFLLLIDYSDKVQESQ
jgi:hypothetical protein